LAAVLERVPEIQSLPTNPHLMLTVPGASEPQLPEVGDFVADYRCGAVQLEIARREGLHHLHTKPCLDTCDESKLANVSDLDFLVAPSYDPHWGCISPTTTDSPCHCPFVSFFQLLPL
jgi:hypothetical protein